MKVQIEIEHNGTTYGGEVMRIKSTTFGCESHGVLTAQLHCEGKGTGVSVGGFVLDERDADSDEDTYRRRGTAYGLDQVMQIMRTVGVATWEELAGSSVVVLWPDTGSHLGMSAVGIAGLMNERILLFAEHAEAWRVDGGGS